MKDNPHVGIIILNWNNYEDTAECIESMNQVQYPNYSIIIVDNGSSDKSGKRLQNEFNECEFVFSDENLGFAGGCNLGIDYAIENGADHVLLINNDITVSPDFLRPLVQTAEQNDSVAAVGSVIYEGNTETIWDAGGEMRPYIADVLRYKQIQYAECYQVDFVTCANILLTGDFLRSNRLDDFYFFGVEEFDLSWTAKNNGWILIINPDSEVYHDVGSSTEELYSGNKFFSAFQKYHNTRGRLYFASKNLKLHHRLVYYLSVVFVYPLFYLWIGLKYSRIDILQAHLNAIYDYLMNRGIKKPEDFN